jgi:hypothetical protein
MSGLSERVRHIHDRILDLNTHVDNFTTVTADIDPISRLKRGLSNGPIAPIGIQSIHKGLSQAVVKITPESQKVIINIYIDDILEIESSKLSYQFTNIDFKIDNTEIIAIIYQENGIIRLEKMTLVHSDEFKKYMLYIQSSQNFDRGRIFIPVSIEVNLSNYNFHPVNLQPLPVQNIIYPATCCRPETTLTSNTFDKSNVGWSTFGQLSVIGDPVSKSPQKVNNPFG